MLTVPVMARKRCVLTRPWKCLMGKRTCNGVHRFGIDLTVIYPIVLPVGQNLAQAPDFHDFEPRIV